MLKAALFTATLANATLIGDLLEEGFVTGQPEATVNDSGRGFATDLPFNTKTATCLKQNGFNTALIRAYLNGNPDNNICDSLKSAVTGGIQYRDAVF